MRQRVPAVALAAAILVAVAYVLPKGSRNPLVETTLWSVLVTTAFVGWGSLVKHLAARDERVDLGLRAIWGAAAMCFLGGLLMAASLMARTAALGLVEVGLVLALLALARDHAAVRRTFRFIERITRREPRVMLVVFVVGALVVLQYLSGIADWHINPYDDDMAYLAFVRKLLDTGSMIEPFSLRRLSALGGQTFFLELVSLRAEPLQGHTFDRSMSVLLIVLLVAGARSRTRRLPLLLSATTVLLVLTLPVAAINTASYYSGVAFFFGLFRTMMWAERRAALRGPLRTAAPLALVAAAICTLRQNYIAVPPLVLGASYVFSIARHRKRDALAEPLACAAMSFVALIPWFIVGWQSNRTFFYPVMLGTANPAMVLSSSSSTVLRELRILLWTAVEGMPLRLIGLFVLAGLLHREAAERKPLWSFFLGSVAGLALLVHGLSQGDASNIGRYAFGFILAFALAVVVTIGTSRSAGVTGGRAKSAAAIMMFAVLAQLVDSHNKTLYPAYEKSFHNIEVLWHSAGRHPSTSPPQTGLYARLQEAVPPGARMAVMLDEPHFLDFRRNPIWNLDMPGYSSLAPGLPYFAGADAVEAYFKAIGVRYVAFVRPGFSRYHYRRSYWVEMLVSDQELWRTHAPYLIDFYDNLVALDAKHGRLFDETGLAVIDLERTP